MAITHTSNAAVKAGYAPVNGIKMYYEVHGEGNGMPLVMIHGGGSTIESSFGVLLPLLSAHRRVIVMELQAHGRTDDRDALETFQQDADDVAALLAYLHIDKADILGFSNGGHTAMQIAISHSQMVNKLVVISAAFRRDGFVKGFFEGFPHATLDNMPSQLKDAFLKVKPDKDRLQMMFEKDVQRMEHFTDWPDAQISSVENATLIIGSDKDVITPDYCIALSRQMQHAELLILPGMHGAPIGEICSGDYGRRLAPATAVYIESFLDGQ